MHRGALFKTKIEDGAVRRNRILLAEDHPLMREAIVSILSREHDVVATVGDGNEVLSVADRLAQEAIVLDVSMPGRSGLQILPQLRIRMPFVAIVVLTARVEPIYEEEAFRRGADGYVLKDKMLNDLLPTICAALLSRRTVQFEDRVE